MTATLHFAFCKVAVVDVSRRAVLALPLVIGGAVALKPENPVVGGTVLRRAAIQSPNFVTGVSGWTINQDGSAEFNNLTLRGVFKGTNYLIDSSGLRFYSGPPAAGNLVASVTGSSGYVDAFGNHVLAGDAEYSGTEAVAVVSTSFTHYTGSLAAGWTSDETVILSAAALTASSNAGQQISVTDSGLLIQAKPRLSSSVSGALLLTNTASTLAGNVPAVKTDTTTPAASNNTVAAAITAAYTIPANDSAAGTVYEIEVPFSGTTEGQTVQWGVLLDSTSRAGTTIGAAFFGLGTAVDGDIKARMLVRTTGAAGQVDFSVRGGVGLSGTRSSGTNNNDAYLSAVQANVAHDTTVSHTMAVYAVFGAAAAGQVITGHGSIFTRKGP